MARHQNDRGRRDQVLEAAIELLGSQGERATTFNGIDEAAGVPPGTASNHFRNRDRLLLTVCLEIEQRRLLDWATRISPDQPMRTERALTQTLTRYVTDATRNSGATATLTRARHALAALTISSQPVLRSHLATGDQMHRDHLHSALQSITPGATELHARMIFDYLSGAISGQLVAAEEVADFRAGIASLLGTLAATQGYAASRTQT